MRIFWEQVTIDRFYGRAEGSTLGLLVAAFGDGPHRRSYHLFVNWQPGYEVRKEDSEFQHKDPLEVFNHAKIYMEHLNG